MHVLVLKTAGHYIWRARPCLDYPNSSRQVVNIWGTEAITTIFIVHKVGKLLIKSQRCHDSQTPNVFYLTGFIESWGRGIEKICKTLKADNLPMPEYTIHPGDIMIRFTGPEDRIVRVNNRVNDEVNAHVNDREKELLNHLVQDPGYTVTQLAEKMNREVATFYFDSFFAEKTPATTPPISAYR